MERPVRISVVIPVKDDAVMLAQCLRSLATQSRPADELIIVDNGSSDDSADIARRAGATVVVEPAPGITAAAARGYDEASGEIIARCDADSVVPPGWLARIERDLGLNPDAVAVTGRGRFYDLALPARVLADVLYMRNYFATMRTLLGTHAVFGSNFAMRRSFWAAVSSTVPRDNPELHDDMDLSYRVPPGSRVINDPGLVVGISGRPFRDPRGFGRRIARAAVTAAEHWPDESPLRRRQRASASTNGR